MQSKIEAQTINVEERINFCLNPLKGLHTIHIQIFGLSRKGEQMDLVHDIIVEEDRISNLSHEIIHHILSFLDVKFAIQTCTLSLKWGRMWASMPHLNLNSEAFPTLPHFAKFIIHAPSNRNNHKEVFVLIQWIKHTLSLWDNDSI